MKSIVQTTAVSGTALAKENRARLHTARNYGTVASALLVALWFAAPAETASYHKLLGACLGALTLSPWYFWLRREQRSIPFFELICLHYCLIVCMPLFAGSVTFVGVKGKVVIEGDDLANVLWISIVGILCFFAGYYAKRWKAARWLPMFNLDSSRAVKWCLVYLALSVFGPLVMPHVPRNWDKLADLIFRVNGSVAVYALSRYLSSGQLNPMQRLAFYIELGLLCAAGLGTGWLSSFVYPLIAFFLGEVTAKKSIPWLKIAVVCVLIIAFNSVKTQFREQVWGNQEMGYDPASVVEIFGNAAHWIALAPTGGEQLRMGAKETISERINHLAFFGHVVKTTPELVEHLYGQTYTSIPAMIIPRVLKPDKPSTMEVPNYLALRYGWLAPHQLGQVAVSAGLMDEAYMNFGLLGVVVVMTLFGLFVRWLTVLLGNPAKGMGWQLVLVGFISGGGLMITWPVASYLGGFWQTSLVIVALYWGVRARGRTLRPARAHGAHL
jgi:hypothetical protein